MARRLKVTRFRDYQRTGKSALEYKYWATITLEETKGWWLWEYVQVTPEVRICREFTSTYWYYVSTGAMTPGFQATELERAYLAKEGDPHVKD